MNKILLTTRPNYDDGTAYLAFYANKILKNAKKLGINTKDFEGKKACCENVVKFVKKKEPKLLFINGHGDENSLEGDEGEILFSTDENLDLLKNKIIYARACHAGLEFGKQVVSGNDGCFIGYTSPFSFWIDEKWSAKPSNDKSAALFLEPSNEIINFLIKGKSTKEANERSKKMMVENMKKLLKLEEKKEPGALGLLQILWNNFEGQILHGNENLIF